MVRAGLSLLLAGLLAVAPAFAGSRQQEDGHRFGVIGSAAGSGEERLEDALGDMRDKSLAFVVVTGIKGADEGCGDKLYQKRRELIDDARRPVIVALAGADWTECRNSAGRTNAIERLNRLRELFYPDAMSLGARKLELTRQSMSPRFRAYAENAHWKVDEVLYATINLPANNNHYLQAAGRNSEYEDRLVANRVWLNRLFAIARRDKLQAVVLFSEGDIKPFPEPTGLRALLQRTPTRTDGFAEPRRQVLALSRKFRGKVLLVDSGALPKGAQPAIAWQGNLGHLSVGGEAVEVRVAPKGERMFSLRDAAE